MARSGATLLCSTFESNRQVGEGVWLRPKAQARGPEGAEIEIALKSEIRAHGKGCNFTSRLETTSRRQNKNSGSQVRATSPMGYPTRFQPHARHLGPTGSNAEGLGSARPGPLLKGASVIWSPHFTQKEPVVSKDPGGKLRHRTSQIA